MDKYFTEAALASMYFIKEAQIPLHLEQITDALFEATDITYINAVVGIDNMVNRKLIEKSVTPAGEFYTLTIDGRITLHRLELEIRGTVRKRLNEYLKLNKSHMPLDSAVTSEITKLDTEEAYQIVLRAYDKDMDMTEIVLHAKDSKQAYLINDNWKAHADDIISVLYKEISKE